MMRLSLCVLLCCALSSASAQSQVPTLLWGSESVFGAKTETSVSYETLRFVDLWNSVLQAFVSGEQENKENAFFTPTNYEPDVFVVFVCGQETPWQLSGDTSASQPLRSAFTQSPARFSFNNVYLESGQVMDILPDSLEAAGADVTYLGSCVNADPSNLESGLKAHLNAKTNNQQKVIVVCGGGTLQDEMKQVETVNKAVKGAKVGYVMMFVSEFGSAAQDVEYLNPQRRKLAQADEFAESEARLVIAYDFCDNLCRTRVKFLEGIILALILSIALTAGLCCMNILDTPTQFEKPEEET